MVRRWLVAAAFALLATLPVQAADIHVMISGGFSEAYRELVPAFRERYGP